jgi:hypothetical protein
VGGKLLGALSCVRYSWTAVAMLYVCLRLRACWDTLSISRTKRNKGVITAVCAPVSDLSLVKLLLIQVNSQ